MITQIPDIKDHAGDVKRTVRALPKGGRAMRRKRLMNRLKTLDVKRTTSRLLARRRKWRQLSRTPHPTAEKLPVFVVGCNRSGTNMICAALGKSPHGWAFQESEFSLAFSAYYLRADWIIHWLIRRTPAPIVSFGCILDSQFTDDLLARFPGSRAIWIYRRYEDVANSCARKTWGSHLKDLTRWVAAGELEKLGSRGKRITPETVRIFGEVFREDLSPEDYACLYWYLRNQLYFDLGLDQDRRVLLVQYEDAVLNKDQVFQGIFEYLGFPFHRNTTEDVFASSVGKNTWPGVDPAIGALCEELKSRLDAAYFRTALWNQPS